MSSPDLVAGQSDFLETMSYELRTPITVIHGALGLLQAGVCGKISEQGQMLLKTAIKNTERLMRLTTSIEQGASAAVEVFSEAMMQRLRLETDLRVAVSADCQVGGTPHPQFQVYYQPLYNLETQEIVGFEALLRWLHPTLGLLSPDQYISLAEESGMIGLLGAWVLRQACRQLRCWQDQFPTRQDLTMSVNLSSCQLGDPLLVQQIQEILQETGVAPTCLKLEITEGGVMQNPTLGSSLLVQLRQMGIQIYIDDFGMGYSSLSRLHELPIDILKIDRSFVSQIDPANHRPTIIQSITALAENLEMTVIAEGIESPEQLDRLKSLGCKVGQGFLFSRPVPAGQIATLLDPTG